MSGTVSALTQEILMTAQGRHSTGSEIPDPDGGDQGVSGAFGLEEHPRVSTAKSMRVFPGSGTN